jgi:hypothetical protein
MPGVPMNSAEFETGLTKFLPILRRKLAYLHGDLGQQIRRFEEEAALDWVVALLDDAEMKRDRERQARPDRQPNRKETP